MACLSRLHLCAAFRLYREIPAELALPAGRQTAAAGAAPAAEGGPAGAAPLEAPAAPPPAKKGNRRGRAAKAVYKLPDPPPPGRWELLASTMDELRVRQRLAQAQLLPPPP